MQHIADFPLDAIHLYKQPQHPAMKLKMIAFLDSYVHETGLSLHSNLCCG